MALVRSSLAVALSLCTAWAVAKTDADASKQQATVNSGDLAFLPSAEALLSEDRDSGHFAMRYGVTVPLKQSVSKNGQWQSGSADLQVWRLPIHAPDALALEVNFGALFLPEGAELNLLSSSGDVLRGPFDDRVNLHRNFRTPYVMGDSAVIEVRVPSKLASAVQLDVQSVTWIYRDPSNLTANTKAGSCNVDVVCPEGDDWRDEIRSVARYTFRSGSSTFLCSGQLMNSTLEDGAPLFLTAHHCMSTQAEAESATFYFNYESAQCRVVGSGNNGNVIPIAGFDDIINGSTLLATDAPTDFTLLSLNEEVPESFDPHYTGWDRRNREFDSATGIHHPQGHEKRISFEFDPITIVTPIPSVITVPPEPNTHLLIDDWDIGTTEGGSSGSAIWNSNKRVVGWLSGGLAACGNDLPDYYGRMGSAWNRTGDADSQLREWLDPIGSNVNFINGRDSCDAPTVSISSSDNPAIVGADVLFSSQVSGGQAPYSYAWDLDSDGQVDWTGDSVPTRFVEAGNTTITLRVTDAASCTGTGALGQVVQGPQLNFTNVANPVEVCGDGDNRVEPGEIFDTRITVRNSGSAGTDDGYLVFARSTGASDPVAGPDSFGYTAFDSNGGNCSFDFVNISNSGDSLDFVPSGTFDALDDGGALVSLDGGGFPFYGNNRSQLVMSSNGYLSTSADDNGGDFDNDCPIPTSPDRGGGGRIMPLHDDLIIGGGLYEYFNNCPRDGEAGNGPCHVFQWDDVGFFGAAGVSFDMQTVLYEDSGQIVYQYGPGNVDEGAGSSVGIQNPNANIGLEYACNQGGSVGDNQAVCLFAPNGQPPAAATDGVRLLTPAIHLGDFDANSTAQVDLRFKVEDSVACGSSVVFDAHGLTFPEGFAPGSDGLVTIQVGGANAQCNANVSCPVDLPAIAPKQGLYNSPLRDGNGVDTYINEQGTMVGTWYTGNKDHSPVWYTSAAPFMDHQMDATLLKVTRGGGGAINATEVGRVLYTFIDDSTALYNYDLDGERSGEFLTEFVFGMAGARGEDTGHHFAPAESGWGTVINQRGDTELNTFYFYDSNGEPIWGLGANAPFVSGSQTNTLVTSFVVCPGCPFVPQQPTDPIGTVTRNFNVPAGTCPDENANDVLVSTDISLPAPLDGEWQRSDVCKEALSAPVSND